MFYVKQDRVNVVIKIIERKFQITFRSQRRLAEAETEIKK